MWLAHALVNYSKRSKHVNQIVVLFRKKLSSNRDIYERETWNGRFFIAMPPPLMDQVVLNWVQQEMRGDGEIATAIYVSAAWNVLLFLEMPIHMERRLSRRGVVFNLDSESQIIYNYVFGANTNICQYMILQYKLPFVSSLPILRSRFSCVCYLCFLYV